MDKFLTSMKFMLILIIFLCVAPFIMGMLISVFIFTFHININASSLMLYTMILTPLFFSFLPLLLYIYVTKTRFRELIPLKKLSVKNIALIILMSILIQPAANLMSALSSLVSPNIVTDVMLELTKIPFWQYIIVSAVMPAIFEELVYRGLILTESRRLGNIKSALLSGLFFGFMHLNLQQFFYAFFMGIIFSFFVQITGSIFSSILSHFVINGTQGLILYLSAYFLPEAELISETEPQITVYNFIALTINATIFLILFYIVFKFFKKANRENSSAPCRTAVEKKALPYFIAIVSIYIIYILIQII